MNGQQHLCAQMCSLALLVMLCGACHEEYDFEHRPPERGTLGQETWRLLARDASMSPRDFRARVALMNRDRERIILSIDSSVPADLVRPLSNFLLATRHLNDNNLLPGMTRKVAVIMDDIATDAGLQEVWAQAHLTPQMTSPNTHSAFVEHAAAFPELRAISLFFARLFLENDGFTNTGGFDANEPEFSTDLVRAVSRALARQTVEGDRERLGLQLGGLLLRSDPLLRTEGASSALVVTQLDIRGMPIVRADAQGRLFSPFVDQDGDGLADLDGEGNFVDAAGRRLEVAPYGQPNASGLVVRDGLGRALAPDGSGFIFELVDLHETAASHLIQQNASLVEEDVVFDLADALVAALPPRQTLTDPETGEPYTGFPADQPLMELAYGLTQALDIGSLDELLDISAKLLKDHPDVVAEILLSLDEYAGLRSNHPGAELERDNTLIDDLVPAIASLAEVDGLAESLLVAMRDPIVQYNEVALRDMVGFKGHPAVPAPGGPYERCFAGCQQASSAGTLERFECVRSCPSAEILKTPMDFSAARTRLDRSHFERLLNLVRATNGVQFEMQITRLRIPSIGTDVALGSDILPPLLRIENASAAFFDATAGNFKLEDYVTEEALVNAEMELLLDGMASVCGTSFLGQLVSRIIPILVTVTEEDLVQTCGRFTQTTSAPNLSDRDRRRKQIAVLVSFLSLLTDVKMDEVPTASQLARFFNTPNPSLDLDILSLSLSELVDHDGYKLHQSDGDMLFALEVTGALEVMYPIIKAFSDRGAAARLADLITVLSLHYPTPETIYNRADGTLFPRSGRGTGMQRYEGLIADWLLIGRFFPALHQLALANAGIDSKRGRDAEEILAEAFESLVRPDARLTHYDGTDSSVRADGGVVRPLSRFYILKDGLESVSERVESDAEASAKWDRATDAALDIFIGVEKGEDGGAVYKNPGSITLTRFITEHLAGRAEAHRDLGSLSQFVTGDILDEVEELLTGRGLPAAVDLMTAINSKPDDKALFKRLLLYSTSGPEGVGHLLVELYELLLDQRDEVSFVTSAHFYGRMLDPDRDFGPQTSALSLVSHSMLLLREQLSADEDGVMLEIIRGATTRRPGLAAADGDPAGAMPLSVWGELVKDYHRGSPEVTAALRADDYALLGSETRDWILDDQRGLEQLFDLIKARKKD